MQQQCELLGVPRSTYYHRPRPESAENLRLLRRLDELYMDCPFFGSRRMAVMLEVNRKRIQRLMRILGIEALYPKPNLSRPAPGHEIYPYLLRGISIERPNQVWSTDITYGFRKMANQTVVQQQKNSQFMITVPRATPRPYA